MAASTSELPYLFRIPLEIRHEIFKYASIREDEEPKKLFRKWFEKKDLAEQLAKTPNAVVGKAGRANDSEADEQDEAAEEDDEDGGDNDGEEDEDEEQEDNEGEGEDEDGEGLIDGDGDGDGINGAEEGEVDEEEEPAVMVEDNEVDADGDTAVDDVDDDDGTATATTTVPPPPPGPTIWPNPKWRHVSKFIRITHYPSPTNLLLVCKQLNEEAMDWYYNVAVLKIKGTTSFMHPTFFEVTLQDITDAAFSPMENIRKAEVELIWDTAWIRASDAIDDIYQALLRNRIQFIVQILSRAPDLKELTIHWHDSAQDSEATVFKADVLDAFNHVYANSTLEEHYIASDFEPRAKSKEGRQRIEYQQLWDAVVSGRQEF